jgi:adenosylhomocysteine nucleosidase
MSGGSRGPDRPPVAPPPAPADVGIVAALSIEVGPLLGRFEHLRKYVGPRHTVFEGDCGVKRTALVVTGPGRAAARRGAELLLAGHRPRWIVSAGFAGGLDPGLRRDDLVLATEVVDLEGGRFAIDLSVPEAAQGQRLSSGRLLTVDAIIRTAAEKAELRRRFGADVVDMETSAVAALCGERAVRFLSVRAISDEAGTDLPPEILSVLGRTGSYRLGAALGALWRRPSSLKELWALREHALSAADRLAQVVPGILARLP